MKIIDITGTIEEGMWSYGPPLPEVEIKEVSTLDKEGESNFSLLLGSISGTYLETGAHSFKELLEALPEDKYPRARAYIDNLSRNVTTFFDIWFAKGFWIPLNTNAIESGFSQAKNRIWTIGKRWSEAGLLNWLKVVVKKVFFPYSWNQLWSEYLAIDSTLQFKLIEVRYQWL